MYKQTETYHFPPQQYVTHEFPCRLVTTAKMMQCFHFMVEPAKTLTAKIKVLRVHSTCLMCKHVILESHTYARQLTWQGFRCHLTARVPALV